MTTTVAILVFDEVEVLDACGPFEVFSVANRVVARQAGPDAAPAFEVLLVAAGDAGPVVARGGLVLQVALGLDDAPAIDLLLVPGGVTDAVERDGRVVGWLADRGPQASVLASVCTGAFLLAEAGLVTDQQVTTHWEDVDALRERWPALDVVAGPRWVRDGDVFTSAGISAGLDLSLHLVEVLLGRDVALGTARQMDYAWDDAATT